jgi:hypothetical protein
MTALGGQDAWNDTRYIAFSFGTERDGKFQGRRHLWDKWSGRYRLEGTTREGDPFVVLMNVNSKDGSAWLEGRKLEGDELKQQLERAYGAWVNDTYWLLMPYKLRDPGVTLAYAGEDTMDGVPYEKIQLSFDNVGLTPKDKYWVWVNRNTGLVDRWDYVLKGEDVPPTTWRWSGWTRHGKIMLAPDRINVGPEGRKLLLPGIRVMETVPDAVFSDPEAKL